MKNDLRLFIGGSEIDLGSSPQILYTYTVDDLQNPTAVKNSFSKTITIDGTPQNNKVFGQYWNVERLVGGGGGSGVDYNASKKVQFTIYVNNEIYESGYVKMEKINCINGRYTYDISLFGGLGDFFYSLSYNDNTGDKKRLSDLNYTETGGMNEFDFVATATTITDAWDALKTGSGDEKWQHINFVPAYNGYPEDFDCDKVIINLSGTSLPASDPDSIFLPQSGCVIADLPQEMTEWEMRDLRSYCQRPAIKMSSIVNACCDDEQNGGYTVDLDPDFFNNNNPYWTKTWLTLPLMKNLEYANEEQTLEGANLVGLTTTGDVNTLMYQDLKFDIGDYPSETPSSVGMKAQVFINNPLSQLNAEINPFIAALSQIEAPYTSTIWFWRNKGDSYHTGWACFGSMFVQMIAMNGEVVVGASPAYNLTSPIRHNGKLYYGHNGRYDKENQFKPYCDMPIYDVLGEFHNDGFHRENSNTPVVLDFTIRGLNSPVSQLKMVYYLGASKDKLKHYDRTSFFLEDQHSVWIDFDPKVAHLDALDGAYAVTVGVTETNFKAVLGASLGRTGTQVGKAILLNTEGSPCDYLLSYCKMFGLYFRKDVDKPVIHIETRKTFYDRNDIVNLEDFIDRGKDIKVNPMVFTTKWYDMVQEQDDSQFYEKYMAAHGIEYGSKLLNTGYEFDVQKKKLYEKSVIRSGIEGLERSKFYSAFNDDTRQRSWMGMGLHYNLFYGGEADYEVNVPIRNNNDLMGINEGEGMKYYDVYPKMQFHGADNDPTDGNNVLVFFSGFKSVTSGRSNPLRYYVSDDNMYQTLLNDSTPCWFFTAQDIIGGHQFVYPVDELPVFERYYTDVNSGKVNKSLDFGTPQELFIPNYNITEDANIYSNYWRTYIDDLFDPNTRILSCYVVANGKVNGDWLRRFYWFDNAIWRINKITDWNLAEFGPTQMEFIKVQNIGNYTVPNQITNTKINLTASKYRVDSSGETVTLTVTVSNGGAWRLTTTGGAVASITNGVGNRTFTATIPANNNDELKGYYFTVSTNDNAQARITIMQGYEGETDFTPEPSHLIFPASGGGQSVNFIWKNQGQDYVESVDYNSGADYLQFTADTTTYRDENKAVIIVSALVDAENVISNICQFRSHNGINSTITIDQLPATISYNKDGGDKSITLSSTGATVTGLPYWVTAIVSGNEITFTALPNTFDSGRTGTATISYPDGSSANIAFEQAASTPSDVNFNVTPDNLYYTSGGGTQYITIISNTPWGLNASSQDVSVSQTQGNGNAMVAITLGEATSSASQVYTLTVTQLSGNQLVENVYISQEGTGIAPSASISVSPSSASVSPTGETIEYTITVTGVNNPIVNIEKSTFNPVDVTIGQIAWTGNTGKVLISYPANTNVGSRSFSLTFYLMQGGSPAAYTTVTATQDVQGEYFNAPTTLNFPSSGETQVINASSNTCWTATTVGSGSGSSPTAIGFATPSWDIKNLIDTGIHPTDTTTIRVKYTGRGELSDRIAGTIDGYGGCDDGHDFRVFDIYLTTIVIDAMSERTYGPLGNISADGTDYDITLGNYFLYDNINNTTIVSGATIPSSSWTSAYTLTVDVGSRWIKEVIVEDNGNVLFSGTPYSNGGVVGLYDSVSNTVKTLYSGSSGTLVTSGSGSTSADWITVSPTSGCGSQQINISTSLNTGAERTGYVKIYSTTTGDLLNTITVKQAGYGTTLSVFPTAISFDSNGGTATFTITTNTNWIIE